MNPSCCRDEDALRHTHCDYRSESSPLLRLPLELRLRVYDFALTPCTPIPDPRAPSYGPHSGLSLSLLRTCRQLGHEALPLFFSHPHTIVITPPTDSHSATPPTYALSRLQHITLQVHFNTLNRGESQVAVINFEARLSRTDAVAMVLRHSHSLRTLRIELLNGSQRKRGRQLVRQEQVRTSIRRLLMPFAYLDPDVKVDVGGFDTIDYAETFITLREQLAGQDLPLEEMLEEVLDTSGTNHMMRSIVFR